MVSGSNISCNEPWNLFENRYVGQIIEDDTYLLETSRYFNYSF